MEIYFEKTNKTENITIDEPIAIKELLVKYNISTPSVILVKNDTICLEGTLVCNSDKLKVLSVVSGG